MKASAFAVCIVSSTVLFWTGIACSEQPDYFPLQVGNSWTYSSGRTETIVGTAVISGKTYYEFDGLPFAFKQKPLYRINERDQLVEYINEELPFFGTTVEAVRYDFSLEAGDTWGGSWRRDPFYSIIFGVQIRSKKETIVVPAGTFTNCLHLEYVYLRPYQHWEEWIAPGVGTVKRAGGYTVFTSLIGVQVEELVEAEVNGVRYPDGSSNPEEHTWPRPSASGIGDYYPPLQVGNSWIYSNSAGEGKWAIDTLRIAGTELVNGHIYYKFNYFPYVGAVPPLFRIDARNRFVEFFDGKDMVRYRSPINVRDSWVYTPVLSAPLSLDIVAGVNETVVVPAGTFADCVHITHAGSTIWEEWIAPGIGAVRFINYGGLFTTTWELLEANVNGLRYPTSVEPNTWGEIKINLHSGRGGSL